MFLRLAFVLILFYGSYLSAAGGPPMMVDGTGTPGDGNWELNIAYKGERQNPSRRYEAPSFDLNYGLSDTVQLKAETSYIELVNSDKTKDHGIGNAKAGIKWRFYENDTFSISTYPQYTFVPIKKNLNSGLADFEEAFYLPLEINKQLGSIAVVAEVGYLAVSHTDNYLNTGFQIGYRCCSQIELLAEIYRSAHIDGHNESVTLNSGLSYTFKPNVNGLLSVGKEIVSPSYPKPVLFFIGLQLLFN